MDVSVIIPVYNREDRMVESVRSVLGQTGAGVELIVVDDGSTTASGSLMAGTDPRLRRILLERNCGVSAARNAGLSAATGRYVLFVDCGDRLEADGLGKLLTAAEEADADAIIGGYRLDVSDELRAMGATGTDLFPGGHLTLSASPGLYGRMNFPDLLVTLLQNDLLHPLAGRLYRRAALPVEGFDESVLYLLEDEMFNLDFLRSAGRVAVIAETVCIVDGIDLDSLSRRYDDDRLLNVEKLWEKYQALLTSLNCAMDSALGHECLRQLIYHYIALLENWRRSAEFADPVAMFHSARRLIEAQPFREAASVLGLGEQWLVSTLNSVLDAAMPRLRRLSFVFEEHGDWLQYGLNCLEMVRANQPTEALRHATASWEMGGREAGVRISPDRLWRAEDD